VHLGAYESDIRAVEVLEPGMSYNIKADLQAPHQIEDLLKTANFDDMESFHNIPINEIVKLAEMAPDATSVDAVLSLGLMKKYNIQEYLNLIPDYERVVGELAKLLIMIRMGLTIMPEEPVKTTMEALATTIQMLKQLSKVNNK
jgi:hypothetical protein